jgi:predicted transcriptional regulator YdeE
MTEKLFSNNADIRVLPELKLVGFRVLCKGEEYAKEIPKASRVLHSRLAEIKKVTNPKKQIGAFIVDECTAEEDGYWICVEVENYGEIPKDMVTVTIPSQRYAVLKHRGANHSIKNTYELLYEWIEVNKYKRLKDKWHLEVYHSWEHTENVSIELFNTI